VTPTGEHYAAVDMVSDFERIEEQVTLGLALCIAASALLAALLARFTAGRVIAPVTALAEAVRQGSLQADARLLARNDEIGLLARAFAERAQALQQALQREQLFTGDVSHELRTPLTVILGAAEVLDAQLDGQAAARAAIERIQRTARNTGQRVAALLLLARAPERLSAPQLALLPLIEREIERCRPLLADKPVQLVLQASAPVHVFAHVELAEMAIGNLLRNACQYTQAGRITLSLQADELRIEDSGPGLPATVRDHLFERHPRGDADGAATGEGGGAGLGLSLVKRIVEHLGWRIRFEQPDSGGSRFVMNF
jgi:signal transduction histidine kinase